MEPSIGMDQPPAGVRLFILGGFRLERDGRHIPDSVWQRRSPKRLVKLLATVPGQRLHREQIQDLLWPELAPDKAANALRKALHLARRALEPDRSLRHASSYLSLRDDLVQLEPNTVWIDAVAFQSLGEAALVDGGQPALEQALAIYSGELLPEDRYEDWTSGPRTTLADLHLALLRELAAVHERAGRVAAAVESLKQVIALDPVREHAHRQVMRLFAESGQRHQALRQYQACRAALRQQLDADPDPVTELLYEEIQTGRTTVVTGAAPPVASRRLPVPARLRLSEELVGRERSLASLVAQLNRAEQGAGGTMLLGGEAGVGKTRLIAELARDAHDRRGQVLWGACYEQEGHIPYGPIVEAIDRALAGQAADVRQRLGAAYPELTPLIPALGSAGLPSGPIETDRSDRAKLFAAIARLLDELRGDQTLLLVLDDLHAADSATLQLLHYLTRLAIARPWLIVGSVREEDVILGREFHRFRAAVMRAALCHRIDLDRLDRQACRQLIDSLLNQGTVPNALHDDIYDRSLGNPLYARELVQAMRDQGTLALDHGVWVVADGSPTAVPRRLHDLIEARVYRLGDNGHGALALLATAGHPCSFRLLRATDVLSDEPLLDALDQALTFRLIEEQDGTYGFSHPLVGRTLYQGLTRPRRIRLHAALAAAIERQAGPDADSPERVADLAHHWAEAGDTARAVPYLVQAAETAAKVYANHEAIARLERALALLADHPDVQLDGQHHRAALRERLGDLLALTGDSASALAAFEAARRDDPRDEQAVVRLPRKAARQALVAGELAAADRLLTETEALLQDQSSAATLERARVLTVRSQSHYLAARFPEALAAAEASGRLAETAASPVDVAQAREMVAMACLTLGHWRRGMEVERDRTLLTDLNQFVRDAADVHLCLGEYYVHREPEQAVRTATTFLHALAESERVGAPRSLALCHYYLGYAAYFSGQFDEAMGHLTESIHHYDRVGSAAGKAIALMVRGVTQTALGLLDQGHDDLQHGLQAAEQSTLRSHAMIRLYAGLARNRLDANDPDAARWYVEAGLALADEPSTCICYAAIHPIAAIAFALTGDIDRAVELTQRSLAQAQALNSPGFLTWSYQAIAITETMLGNWTSAFGALDTARGLAERHGFPYEHGRILLLRAFVHLRRRRPRDLAAATALTAEASPVLVRLGVRASAAQARSSLGFLRGHLVDRSPPVRASA